MSAVKNNADPHAVLNQLYASSRLQESYSANMMAIVDGRPVLMTLPHMLHVHVAHREQVIERRAAHELEKARARAHILEGLVLAQQRIDDVVAAACAAGRGAADNKRLAQRAKRIWPGSA